MSTILKSAWAATTGWLANVVAGWNRFWFTPSDAATLGLLRILTGAMLFYTHLVWTLGLEDFFGPNAWVRRSAVDLLPYRTGAWTYFSLIDSSPALLWTAHLATLAIFAMLTLGVFSRVTSVLAFICAVSYANRVPGALFGLDDTELMLALYLMVGPSGAAYSLDRWWKTRRERLGAGQGARVTTVKPGPLLKLTVRIALWLAPLLLGAWWFHVIWLAIPLAAVIMFSRRCPDVSANVAIRLLQVHLCIVYMFSGMGKLLGPSWWDGTAIWSAVANLEYQSIDLTWLHRHLWLVNILTHLTVFWEVFYCALIWPRLTRPLALLMAVGVHLGIGMAMGMMTFGLIMIVANVAFIPPATVRAIFGAFRRGLNPEPIAGAGQGGAPRVVVLKRSR